MPAGAQPSAVGEWGPVVPLKPTDDLSFTKRTKGIHAILIPHSTAPLGKVLLIDHEHQDFQMEKADVVLVDPSLEPSSNPDAIKKVLEGAVPGSDVHLFCSGHSMLAGPDAKIVFRSGRTTFAGQACHVEGTQYTTFYIPDLTGNGIGTWQVGP